MVATFATDHQRSQHGSTTITAGPCPACGRTCLCVHDNSRFAIVFTLPRIELELPEIFRLRLRTTRDEQLWPCVAPTSRTFPSTDRALYQAHTTEQRAPVNTLSGLMSRCARSRARERRPMRSRPGKKRQVRRVSVGRA